MSNIKILDVFGQFRIGAGADSFSSGSVHQFIFPSKWKVEGDWKVYINDVRSLLNDIPKAYASWCNNEGWWIAAIVKNEQDTRQGYAIFSVCLGNNLPQYGLLAIRMLDSIAQEFIKQENWDLGQLRTEEKLKSLSNDIELGSSPLMPSAHTQPTAVRRYKSDAELHDLFGNLAQPYHKRYSRVIYVADSVASSLTPNSYKDITDEAIAKGYEIKCAPADGKVSTTRAMKGDEVTLTFKNIAEMTETVTFIAGQDTPYATYDDNVITIKKHNILRLIGDGAFSIRCTDETGKELTGWAATPRTSTVALAIDGDKCLFPSASDKQVQIGISLQGYKPATVDVKLPNIPPQGHIETVVLKKYETPAQTAGTKTNEPAKKTPIIAIAGAIAAILIVGIILVFTLGGDDAEETTTVAVENVADSDAFKNDIFVFKNQSSRISKTDLQSEEFKALLDYIALGNCEMIVEQLETCYGTINGNDDVNQNLRSIYSKLTQWMSSGNDTNVSKFSQACKKSSHYNDPAKGTAINLANLNKALQDIINPPVVNDNPDKSVHKPNPGTKPDKKIVINNKKNNNNNKKNNNNNKKNNNNNKKITTTKKNNDNNRYE